MEKRKVGKRNGGGDGDERARESCGGNSASVELHAQVCKMITR